MVEARYGDIIREEFGISPNALIGDAALVIASYRDADALRSAVAAARGDRQRRLLQKGLREVPPGQQSQVAPTGWGDIDGGPQKTRLTSVEQDEKIRAIVRMTSGLADVTYQELHLPNGAPEWSRLGV
ncbi:hypothetical protein [Mesorhizobium sp. M7A.F.Ca.MR.176.00.0.0]|uniref:hypothetical protein n=1 Tax=Mesorhizobium sp. M7A.F.Ca.MR.176.00.0.0 TaxID=2496776 RepID=UPI0013E402F3|nr:hypothetical protein [Mesorhizobium sp. M7A.F.Ca.MR.176.00.0.0]